MSEEVEEVRELAVEVERHLLHFGSVGTDLVSENVVGGKADRQQICVRTTPNIFEDDEFLGEIEFVFIRERRRADHFIKTSIRAIFAFAVRGGTQERSL